MSGSSARPRRAHLTLIGGREIEKPAPQLDPSVAAEVSAIVFKHGASPAEAELLLRVCDRLLEIQGTEGVEAARATAAEIRAIWGSEVPETR